MIDVMPNVQQLQPTRRKKKAKKKNIKSVDVEVSDVIKENFYSDLVVSSPFFCQYQSNYLDVIFRYGMKLPGVLIHLYIYTLNVEKKKKLNDYSLLSAWNHIELTVQAICVSVWNGRRTLVRKLI